MAALDYLLQIRVSKHCPLLRLAVIHTIYLYLRLFDHHEAPIHLFTTFTFFTSAQPMER